LLFLYSPTISYGSHRVTPYSKRPPHIYETASSPKVAKIST
jgi:hypothetical protein